VFFANPALQAKANSRGITIYEYDSINKDFIFIDDNMPAYQRAAINHPAIHYTSTDWQTCKIDFFIAPLYTKIHLEAFEKEFI
jgi:hypothetical protein